jgi:hypothetical protein
MILTPEIKDLLSKISDASRHSLQRAMDLGILLQLSASHKRRDSMENLAFHAKFVTKSFELLKRIGTEGEGYDKLYAEFTSNIERCRALIKDIIEDGPEQTRILFEAQYLSLSTTAMENLMSLIHDLSWYKNYLIDSKGTA